MKNFWFALGAVLLISSCSDKKEEQTQVSELSTEQALEAGEQIVAKPQFDIKFEEITYHYDAGMRPEKASQIYIYGRRESAASDSGQFPNRQVKTD